jgi:hypothetical protein
VSPGEKRKGFKELAARESWSSAVTRVAVVSELSSELELKSVEGRDSVVIVTQL